MCTASSHSKNFFSTIAGCSSSLSIHLGIISSFHSLPPIPLLKKKDKDSTKGKGRCCCLGEELIQFLAALFWDLNTVLVWARLRFSRILHCTVLHSPFPGFVHCFLYRTLVLISKSVHCVHLSGIVVPFQD